MFCLNTKYFVFLFSTLWFITTAACGERAIHASAFVVLSNHTTSTCTVVPHSHRQCNTSIQACWETLCALQQHMAYTADTIVTLRVKHVPQEPPSRFHADDLVPQHAIVFTYALKPGQCYITPKSGYACFSPYACLRIVHALQLRRPHFHVALNNTNMTYGATPVFA